MTGSRTTRRPVAVSAAACSKGTNSAADFKDGRRRVAAAGDCRGAVDGGQLDRGALDAVIVRYVAVDVHPFEIVFFRNLFSLVFLALFLSRIGPDPLRSSNWPVHAVRAVMKLAALIAYFQAVTLLPLSVAITVAFTTPLFVSLGSMMFLGERPRPLRLLALAAGFTGVCIVLRPDSASVGLGAVLALAAAIGLAGVAILMKVSSAREPALRIV